MKIKSKYNAVWHIDTPGAPLDAADVDYITEYRPAVYCNDLTGLLWCFDTRLPSGRWLECIHPANDLRTVSALVM